MKKMFAFSILLCFSISCSEEKLNEIESINQLDFKTKENIKLMADQFKKTLTRENILALYKTQLNEVLKSAIIRSYLSNFNSTDKEIADKILQHPSFGFNKSINTRSQNELVSFSAPVQSLMDQLTNDINTSVTNFTSTGDFYSDKQSLNYILSNVINDFESNIWSNSDLIQSEREILLGNVEYHKNSIPDLIEMSIVISDSVDGVETVSRVKAWKKFWRIVAVVVVTTVAAAVIGAAAGALIAYANATIIGASVAATSAAVTVASWVGL